MLKEKHGWSSIKNDERWARKEGTSIFETIRIPNWVANWIKLKLSSRLII